MSKNSLQNGLQSQKMVITLPANDFSNSSWGPNPTPINPTANTDFIITMPQPVYFQGLWSVSLLEIVYAPAAVDTTYYVYIGGLIEPQIVGSGLFSLLGTLPGQSTAATPYVYRQQYPLEERGVNQSSITQLQITIRDGQGNVPIFDSTYPTIITLLFNRQQ